MRIRPLQPFGSYWVFREYASGGMSLVHLALTSDGRRFVALKTLLEELWDEEDYQQRFRREVAIHQRLHHPHVVRFLEGAAGPDACFLAMELVRGQPLDELLLRHPHGLPVPTVVRIMEALTAALFHIHSKGVLHRDLQPRNVMMEDTGGIKLFDFGIAQVADDLLRTRTGTIMGTFAYSSPEQNQGRPVDERSDLYSLGLLFHELLTGTRAIQGSGLLEITEFQLRSEILPPSHLRREIPAGLSALVHRLVQRHPEDRPATSRHLLDELIQLKATAGEEDRVAFLPEPADSQLDLARRLLHAGRHDQALSRTHKALELRPDRADAWLTQARILVEMGRSEDARAAFDMARRHAPGPDADIDYAMALHALSKTDEAMEVVQETAALHEDHLFARAFLAFLRVARPPRPPVLPPPPPEPGEGREPSPPPVETSPDLSLGPMDPVAFDAPEGPEPVPAPEPTPPPPIPEPLPESFEDAPAATPGSPSNPGADAGFPEVPVEEAGFLPGSQAPAPTPGPGQDEIVDLESGEEPAASPPRPPPPRPTRDTGRLPEPVRSLPIPPDLEPPPARRDHSGDELAAELRAGLQQARTRDEDLAASLSALLPGLGEIYLGELPGGVFRLLATLLTLGLAGLVAVWPIADPEDLARRGLGPEAPATRLEALAARLAPRLVEVSRPPQRALALLLLFPLPFLWRAGRRRIEEIFAAIRHDPRVVDPPPGLLLHLPSVRTRRGAEYAVLAGLPGGGHEWLGDALAVDDGPSGSVFRLFLAKGVDRVPAGSELLLRTGARPSPLVPPSERAARNPGPWSRLLV